jgi:hypothetical protein
MSKLTEDDAVRLLRETFADREQLLADLPSATTSTTRRRGPIVLASAAVVAVLGGVLYVGGATSEQEPGPAQVTVTNQASPSAPSTAAQVVSAETEIWAAVIEEAAQREQPAKGWAKLVVLDAPHRGAGDPIGAPVRATPFSTDVRNTIESRLASTAPLEWVRERPKAVARCGAELLKGPIITVGPVVRKGGHVEVGVSTWRSCQNALWLTYRLDRQGKAWQVTGTVGPQAIS